jgi:hypothetical protein
MSDHLEIIAESLKDMADVFEEIRGLLLKSIKADSYTDGFKDGYNQAKEQFSK